MSEAAKISRYSGYDMKKKISSNLMLTNLIMVISLVTRKHVVMIKQHVLSFVLSFL